MLLAGNVALQAHERCSERINSNQKALEEMRPDVAILAGQWREYEHAERIGETIEFLHKIGVRRVVIVGTPPLWPEPPQLLLFKAYQAHPADGIPVRLQGFDKSTLDFDHRLKAVADRLGAVFVSSYDILCNEAGCLTRLGNTARDIIQVDQGHLSAAGSWFLVSHIEDRIFGDIGSDALSVPTTTSAYRGNRERG